MRLVLLAVVMCVGLVGCSKGPSDKVAMGLFNNYFPDVEQVDMAVLKTHEKDGELVVVMQANDMLCDMPVIKGKDGWIARGVSCNGNYTPSEKGLQARKQKIILELDKVASNINKKTPQQVNEDTKLISAVMDKAASQFVLYYQSYVQPNKDQLGVLHKALEAQILKSDCVNEAVVHGYRNGIAKVSIFNGKDGSQIAKIVANEENCRAFSGQQAAAR